MIFQWLMFSAQLSQVVRHLTYKLLTNNKTQCHCHRSHVKECRREAELGEDSIAQWSMLWRHIIKYNLEVKPDRHIDRVC